MNLNEINKIIIEEEPDTFTLSSFSQKDRELVVAFTFDGGPNEDKVFIVKFIQTVAFHIPSIIHQSIIFNLAHHSNARHYIPFISFDEEEFGEDGYEIILLLDSARNETGYYIAADNVISKWLSYEEYQNRWNG